MKAWTYKIIWIDEKRQGPHGKIHKLLAERIDESLTPCVFEREFARGWQIGDEWLINKIISHYSLSANLGYCGDGFAEFKRYSA